MQNNNLTLLRAKDLLCLDKVVKYFIIVMNYSLRSFHNMYICMDYIDTVCVLKNMP